MSSRAPIVLLEQSSNPVVSADAVKLSNVAAVSSYTFDVGNHYYGLDAHVEYVAGDLPIIITVPHGGYGVPDSIPDRTGGCHEHDYMTQELARELLLAFERRHGGRPHMVLNQLARVKLDMNRPEKDACEPCEAGIMAWRQFHAFVDRAKQQISERTPGGMGLVVDLHGQSHDHRHQLGYVLNAADLCCTDAALDDGSLHDKCTLRAACCSEHPRLSQVVRGLASLGALLESRDCPCVPSPSSPEPGDACKCYFNGGYNTKKAASPAIIALQIESAFVGARDSPENMSKFAGHLADSLMVFTSLHLQAR
jgi:hypothetical protein